LVELVAELDEQKSRGEFVNSMKQRLQKVLPHVKEQFLKEWISNKTYGSQDLEYYQELLGIELNDKTVRLLLFRLEGSYEYEQLFALQNIAQDVLQETLLSATIGGHLLILLEDEGNTVQNSPLLKRIAEVREVFCKFYKMDVTIAISDADLMIHSRRLYRQTLQCLNHRFGGGRFDYRE